MVVPKLADLTYAHITDFASWCTCQTFELMKLGHLFGLLRHYLLKLFFFPGEGPSNFYFLLAPPQIINGRPLTKPR